MKLTPGHGATILQALAGVVCAAFALHEESRGWATANAFLAGINLSGAFYNWLMLRWLKYRTKMGKAYEDLHNAFDQMRSLNEALIHDRVILHLKEISSDDKPSMH